LVRDVLETKPVNEPSSSISYRTQPQARMSWRAALIVCASTIAVAVAAIALAR